MCARYDSRESQITTRDGHDGTTGSYHARARRNRRARRTLQGHAGKIRARTRGIFRHHAGKGQEDLAAVAPTVLVVSAVKKSPEAMLRALPSLPVVVPV